MSDRAIASFIDSTPRPADFDQFWDQTRAELASTPADLRYEPEPLRSNDVVETYAVRFSSLGGARIFAWLCLPRGRSACPGLVLPPGYSSPSGVPRAWAA